MSRDEARDAFREDFRRSKKADDEESFGFEIEKEAGLGEDVVLVEKIERPLLFRARAGDLKGRVPAAFHVEGMDRSIGSESMELREVRSAAGEDLIADRRGEFEQFWERELDGRGDGEVGIGDEFEAVERELVIGTVGDDPAEFHLRESGDFGEAGHAEGETRNRG